MEVISQNIYKGGFNMPNNVSQIERIVRVEREEYIEVIIDGFIEGLNEITDKVIVIDDDYVQEYTLGCDLNQSDINHIRDMMDMKLLDDDYGSEKSYELLRDMLEDLIPKDWTDEFETIEMRC